MAYESHNLALLLETLLLTGTFGKGTLEFWAYLDLLDWRKDYYLEVT
jgi:hypothetical protein